MTSKLTAEGYTFWSPNADAEPSDPEDAACVLSRAMADARRLGLALLRNTEAAPGAELNLPRDEEVAASAAFARADHALAELERRGAPLCVPDAR
jgi:hypothetical protein